MKQENPEPNITEIPSPSTLGDLRLVDRQNY